MALPELYKEQEFQRQTFDRNSEFMKHNPNLTARGTRKFNRYWNSDQRLKDEKAFNAAQDAAEVAHIEAEAKKRADSWDARIAALREQNAARGEAALKNINASLAAKPAIPTPKPEPKPASNPVAKTLIPRSEPLGESSPEFIGPVLSPKSETDSIPQTKPIITEGQFRNSKYFRGVHGMSPNAVITVGDKNYPIMATTGLYGNTMGLTNDHTYAYDPETGKIRKVYENFMGMPFNQFDHGSEWIDPSTLPLFNKQGGKMNRINYFQQGGAAPQQQDMQAQVVALVQAAMQGDQKATQTVNQIMEAAKAGDQQAIQIAKLMEQVIKQMQGQARAAKYGAKLDYLQSLKCGGKAKKKEQGGKVCPECEKTAVNKKKLITKHQQGKTLDYAKATRFYNKWTPEEITKLQMFLSNTDKLGDAAYTGEWGKMNKETLDAIAAYQTNHKLTGDGMWGFWTDQVHGVMDNATLNKGSYTADYNNKHEQGDLLALPTNFTYTKLSDLSTKDAQAVIDYYSAYPELLYSDDPEHAKWRQVFHNSGKDGADFLNQAYGSLMPEERAAIDAKKTTRSHKIAEINNAVTEGTNRAATQLLPALTLPFAIGGVTSVLAGGAGLAGYAGLAGSIAGSAGGAGVGKAIGRKIGEKNADKPYVDDVSARYGVGSSVIDPKRRIREGEERGERIGGITGGILGGALSGLLGAKAQAKYYNTAGKGRAKTNAKASIEEEADLSLQPMGYTKPGKVKGDSTLKLFFKGLKQSVKSDKGQTRTGGPTGLKIRHKGKTYNPGNYVSDEVLQAGKTLYETPDSPITVVLGGDKNLGTGVKLSAAYQTNAVPAMNAGLMTTPAVMVTEDAISDTQPNHSVRQQRRADRKEERKEKRQERHKKLVSRTAESTTD